MFINNRAVQKSVATFTDISAIVSDLYGAGKAVSIAHATDALYIGSDMPFNHRFFMLSKDALNSVAGSVSVAIWDGTDFTTADDIQDFTSDGTAPFAKSGLIRWALPRNTSWCRVWDAEDIPELEAAGIKSKARYWAKLTFSADFAFTLLYMGFRFARDEDLGSYYRDLRDPDVMKAFNRGAAMENWDAVHVVAAEEIIQDLRKDDIIFSPNQILNPELFTGAACHKLAEIAFKQLRIEGRKEDAQKDYRSAMAKKNFDVDRNGSGRLEPVEQAGDFNLRRG